MEYSDILTHLSPCGLDCTRCADFRDGRISQLSTTLKELLGNYERVARLKSDRQPLFQDYPTFQAILDRFSQGPCGGCRSETVACPINCKVVRCYGEKGVDFCFQCTDYPCADPMDPRLQERWKLRNDRMKEIGVVAFYDEQIVLPRY